MDSINGFGTTGFGYGQYGYMSPSYQLERQHYMERMEAVQRQAARAHKGDHSVLMGEYNGEDHGAIKSAGLIAGNLVTGAAKGAWNLFTGMFTDSHGDFSLAQTALTVLSFTAVGAAFRGLSLISKTAPALLKMGLGATGAYVTLPTALKDAGRVASHYVHGNYEAAEEAANDLGQDLPGTALAIGAFRSGSHDFIKAATNKNVMPLKSSAYNYVTKGDKPADKATLVDAFKAWATEKQESGFTQAQTDISKATKAFRTQRAQFKSPRVGTPANKTVVQPKAAAPEASTTADTASQIQEKVLDVSKQVLDYGSAKLNNASATVEGLKSYKPKWTDSTYALGGAKAIGYTQIPLMMYKSERSLDQAGHGEGEFYPGMGGGFIPGSPGIPFAGTNGTGFNIPTVIDLTTGAPIGQQQQSEH